MNEPKATMPNKDVYVYKTPLSDEYKIFNQSDIDDLRAILKYHEPYRNMLFSSKMRGQVR